MYKEKNKLQLNCILIELLIILYIYYFILYSTHQYSTRIHRHKNVYMNVD